LNPELQTAAVPTEKKLFPQVIYPYQRKRYNMVVAGSACPQPYFCCWSSNWEFLAG